MAMTAVASSNVLARMQVVWRITAHLRLAAEFSEWMEQWFWHVTAVVAIGLRAIMPIV